MLVATILEVAVNAPLDPAVCDSRVRLDLPLLVTTLAVYPRLAALMASATPESVL